MRELLDKGFAHPAELGETTVHLPAYWKYRDLVGNVRA